MTSTHTHESNETCPKRAWTLSVLSDESPLDEQGALPQGLEFHLSRCPSCRALADRVLAVTAALADWSQSPEPHADFVARANDRVLKALGAGVAPEGHAEWPDDLLVAGVADRARRWRVGMRYAAVAAVMAMIVWAAREDAVRTHGDMVVQTRQPASPSGAAPSGDTLEEPAEERVSAPEIRTAQAPPLIAPPGRDAADPVTVPFWPDADEALERAWIPGRDYGPILLNSVDNEPKKPSNKPLRDEP